MKIVKYIVGSACVLILCACSGMMAENVVDNENGTVDVASQWPEANKLFERDVHWRGSDDAYSIQLGPNRVLWLFGDTLISSKDEIVPRLPDYVKMPRNSVGIMHGLNPATASIDFYWGNKNSADNPKSFFVNPDVDETNWFWPGFLKMDKKSFLEIVNREEIRKPIKI
jgi:hypothetical protein